MKKTRLVMGTLVLLVIALTCVRAVVANNISTNGVALGELQDKNAHYAKENIMLKEKILTLSSLTNVASEAARLGFVKQGAIISLSAPIPLALKR